MSPRSDDAGDLTQVRAHHSVLRAGLCEGRNPDPSAFLVADEQLNHRLLIELLHIDLEFRLKAGDPGPVESYLGDFPELAHDRPAVLELIAAEYDLRRRLGGEVNPEDFGRRFPDYEDLPRRLALQDQDTLAPAAPANPTCPRRGPKSPATRSWERSVAAAWAWSTRHARSTSADTSP